MRIDVQQAVKKLKMQYADKLSERELNVAIARGLNHTARKGRTEANKTIRQVFNVGTTTVNKSLSIKSAAATTRNVERHLTAYLIARSRPIDIKDFGATQNIASYDRKSGTTTDRNLRTTFNRKGIARSIRTKPVPKRKSGWNALRFKIYKGRTETLPGAFINTTRGGNLQVMGRGTYGQGTGFNWKKSRTPASILSGISVPMMFSRKNVQEPFQRVVERDLEQRIVYEMNYLLSTMGK